MCWWWKNIMNNIQISLFLDHMFFLLTTFWLIWWLMIDDWCCYDMIWYDMIWYDMIWYDMITCDLNVYTVNGENSTDNIGQPFTFICHRISWWFYAFVKESLCCWWGTDDHETVLAEALRDAPGFSTPLLPAWSGLVWFGLSLLWHRVLSESHVNPSSHCAIG